MENEFHKRAFVGSKYDNVYNKKFSLLTFFLGFVYWAYRKMIVEALIFELLTVILEVLILKFFKFPIVFIVLGIFMIAIRVVAGFLFGNLYRKFVNRNVQKIIDKDISDSEQEEAKSCEKKGGTSILFVCLFIILYSIMNSIICVPMAVSLFCSYQDQLNGLDKEIDKSGYIVEKDNEDTDYEDDDNNDDGNEDDDTNTSTNTNTNTNTKNNTNTDNKSNSNTNTKDNTNTNTQKNTNTSKNNSKTSSKTKEIENDEYTYKIYSNIKISEYLDVQVPDVLKEDKEEDYIYNFYNSERRERNVNATIAKIDVDSAEDFIADVTRSNDLSLDDDMYSVELNNLTWYIVGFEINDKIVYYNAFEDDGNIYLLRFDIANDVQDEELLQSYENIITSIQLKEFEEQEEDVDDTEESEDDNTVTNTRR